MNQAKVTQLASDGMENNSKWVDYLLLRVAYIA